jgi:hypothetical protein
MRFVETCRTNFFSSTHSTFTTMVSIRPQASARRMRSALKGRGEREGGATSPVESNHTLPHRAETQFFFGIVL